MDHAVAPPPAVRPRTRARDLITVILLLGSVVFLAAPWGLVQATVVWAIGAGLLWSSPTWSTGEKTIGTLMWPGGLIGPGLALTRVGQVCTQVVQGDPGAAGKAVGAPVCTGFAFSPWAGVPLGVVILAVPFVVGLFLLRRSDTPASDHAHAATDVAQGR